jgi:hypothetical protein
MSDEKKQSISDRKRKSQKPVSGTSNKSQSNKSSENPSQTPLKSKAQSSLKSEKESSNSEEEKPQPLVHKRNYTSDSPIKMSKVDRKLKFLKYSLREQNLAEDKFQRISRLWNSNLEILRKLHPSIKDLGSFSFFKRRFKGLPKEIKSRRMRLELNRLDFILRQVIRPPPEKRQNVSMYDQFLIYQVIHIRNEFKTGRVSQLLRQYMQKSVSTISKQIRKLTSLMGTDSLKYLYKRVISGEFQELAQEVRMSPSLSKFGVLAEHQVKPVRFSFVIDLFLLFFFKDLGSVEFLENWKLLDYVYKKLVKKEKIRFDDGSSWSHGFQGIRGFRKNFAILFEEPEKYLDIMLDFEDRLLQTGFMKGFDLGFLVESDTHLESEYNQDRNSFESVKKNNDSDQDSEDDEDNEDNEDDEDNDDNDSSGKSASQKVKSNSTSRNENQSIQSERNNKNQSSTEKEESISETRKINPIPITLRNNQNLLQKRNFNLVFDPQSNIPKHLNTSDPLLSSEITNLDTKNITFLDYGMNHIQRHFNLDQINIEDLSLSEKSSIINIITDLSQDTQNKSLSRYLFLCVQTNSTSMKHFVRNLRIVMDLIRKIPKLKVSPRVTLDLMHMAYKLNKLIEFVELNYFDASFSRGYRKTLLDLS